MATLPKRELEMVLAKWNGDCDLCANKERGKKKVTCDIRKFLVLDRTPMAVENLDKFLGPYGYCNAFSPKGAR